MREVTKESISTREAHFSHHLPEVVDLGFELAS